MSYENMLMYSSVLPSYDSSKNKSIDDDEVIDADDPRNRDKIMNILKNAK
jgi:hypothetical protein